MHVVPMSLFGFFPKQTGIHFQHNSVMSILALWDFTFFIFQYWKLLLLVMATQEILPLMCRSKFGQGTFEIFWPWTELLKPCTLEPAASHADKGAVLDFVWNPRGGMVTHVSLSHILPDLIFWGMSEWEVTSKLPSDTFRQTQEVFLEDAK